MDDKNNGSNDEKVRSIGGTPSAGSQEIYANANLKSLCVDQNVCGAPYETLGAPYIRTQGQDPLDASVCNFDYDPNLSSTFVLNRVDGSVNGLRLLLSKEDLFFIAWISVQYQINPYFMLAVMAQESAGNCAAVSASNGEGCFQITNTFGQAQLDQSYPDRVADWFWTDRTGAYYPDEIFLDPEAYFGELPFSDQFRLTRDSSAPTIHGTDVSSIVNYNFGSIASALYFYWQQYLLINRFPEQNNIANSLFQDPDGKALWQAAAYNGGAFGARNALRDAGKDFLDEMQPETQNYAQAVVDYCTEFQAGELTYSASYSVADIDLILDLLSYTYPADSGIDWDEVFNDVNQVFFEDGTTGLTFVDDIKALVYVISTHVPALAPEWPDEGSI